MIWFTCKQCGKTHKRPEEAAGTLVYCTCGEGNRVPWESTAPPQEEPPRPEPAEPRQDEWPRRRPREERVRDPEYCFNHEEAPATQTCADCGEPFCGACVVTMQDRVLCGPCKNFRVRTLQRPKRVSVLAVLALVAGLASGPFTFCLSLPLFNPQTGGLTGTTAALAAAGLVLPLATLVLGIFALREIETKREVGGRGTAVTGMATAAAGLLWCLAILMIVGMKFWTE